MIIYCFLKNITSLKVKYWFQTVHRRSPVHAASTKSLDSEALPLSEHVLVPYYSTQMRAFTKVIRMLDPRALLLYIFIRFTADVCLLLQQQPLTYTIQHTTRNLGT